MTKEEILDLYKKGYSVEKNSEQPRFKEQKEICF